MNNKNLLFIVPNLRYGGTISSLNVMYSYLKNNYNIWVYTLTYQNDADLSFSNKIIYPNSLLSLYYSNSKELFGFKKIVALLIKFLCRNIKYRSFSLLNVFMKFDKIKLAKMPFDKLIAFQEGPATLFGSDIDIHNKIAWVHCSYDYYINDGDELEIYKKYNHIVCVSRETSRVFREYYPILSDKVSTIYNLIDEQRILRLSHEDINDVIINKNILNIISVGRISPVKRFECIPEIANDLIKKGVDFHWYIVGPNCSTELKNRIENNIIDYNVKDYVSFIGGRVNPYPYFKACDVCVCLSDSEACPMIFIEANLLGLMVVTTNFPSASEFIKHEVNGFVTQRNNISNLIKLNSHSFKVMSNSKLRISSIISNEKIIKNICALFNMN